MSLKNPKLVFLIMLTQKELLDLVGTYVGTEKVMQR